MQGAGLMSAFDFSASFAGINNAIDGLGKRLEARHRRQGLAEVGKTLTGPNPDYAAASSKLMELGDLGSALSVMKYGQDARNRQLGQDATRALGEAIGGGLGPLGAGVSAPSAGAARSVALGSPNEVESNFVDTVRGAGLTNPVGLGAVAAYGNAESSFSPQNAARTWSDPSERGQPGTSGGVMSWRGDRLANLQRFAAGRGEQGNGSPQTQALFLAQEDPSLIAKLQAARSPEEANKLLANAWRFAGFDRPGGEFDRRLALTQQYAQRFGGQADQPAPGATLAALETGRQGFAVPGGQPAMDGGAFDQITAGMGTQPLRPSFEAEGASQPWMGSALTQTERTGSPTGRPMVANAPLPPRRPPDLADAPAPGAVPAMGQMPQPYAEDLSNSPDGGSRTFAVREAQAQAQPAAPQTLDASTSPQGWTVPISRRRVLSPRRGACRS
jgi:hypothetical protein